MVRDRRVSVGEMKGNEMVESAAEVSKNTPCGTSEPNPSERERRGRRLRRFSHQANCRHVSVTLSRAQPQTRDARVLCLLTLDQTCQLALCFSNQLERVSSRIKLTRLALPSCLPESRRRLLEEKSRFSPLTSLRPSTSIRYAKIFPNSFRPSRSGICKATKSSLSHFSRLYGANKDGYGYTLRFSMEGLENDS